jgi:hypothetical protein
MSGVSSEERERLEENLADVEEATEQRMHSVADLIPEKGQEIHERADRLSESAEEHRRRVQRRRADDDERDVDGQDPAKISANLPVFEQIARSAWKYCACTFAGAPVSE